MATIEVDQLRASRPQVFLSYAHDDQPHKDVVLRLADFLATRGIAVDFDMWLAGERRDWYAWVIERITASDFVIVVASPRYRAVGDGGAPSDQNRGVQAEASALRELLYTDREQWLPKILPVVLPGRALSELPTFVQAFTASHFLVPVVNDAGLDELLRVITGQPRHLPPHIGEVPVLPPVSRPGGLGWNPLPQTPDVRWRADLNVGNPEHATLELHLVPTDPSSRVPVRRLASLPEELAAHGRATGFFAGGDELLVRSSPTDAIASTESAGLAVRRDGCRSIWGPLPRADVGSIFDLVGVSDKLGRFLSTLTSIEVPLPSEMAPSVGLDPVSLLRFGPSESWRFDLPERVRLAADESVSSPEVLASATAVADELAARLAAALRSP